MRADLSNLVATVPLAFAFVLQLVLALKLYAKGLIEYRFWGRIALVYFLLALEIRYAFRYALSNAVHHVAGKQAIQFGHGHGQAIASAMVIILAALACHALIVKSSVSAQGIARALSITCAFAIGAILLIQLISMHELDALMYESVYEVKVAAWLFAALGGAACVAATLRLKSAD